MYFLKIPDIKNRNTYKLVKKDTLYKTHIKSMTILGILIQILLPYFINAFVTRSFSGKSKIKL